MYESIGTFLTIILEIVFLTLFNIYTFKLSKENFKNRIIAGVIFLLLSPIIFFGTLFFVLIFDRSGWGAGILSVFFTFLFLLNGIIILLTSIPLYFKKRTHHDPKNTE